MVWPYSVNLHDAHPPAHVCSYLTDIHHASTFQPATHMRRQVHWQHDGAVQRHHSARREWLVQLRGKLCWPVRFVVASTAFKRRT